MVLDRDRDRGAPGPRHAAQREQPRARKVEVGEVDARADQRQRVLGHIKLRHSVREGWAAPRVATGECCQINQSCPILQRDENQNEPIRLQGSQDW